MATCGALGHVFPPWPEAGERCACGRFERNESVRGLVACVSILRAIERALPIDEEADRLVNIAVTRQQSGGPRRRLTRS